MLRFLLDEHLRGPLWHSIIRHNAQGRLPIDCTRVGDAADLPLGSDDAVILVWAERECRILLTEDAHTMPGHMSRHLQSGRHSPGIFVIRSGCSTKEIVSHLELVAHAGESRDYEDSIVYAP